MKKEYLLKVVTALPDGAEIFMEIEGGEYWSEHLDHLQVEVEHGEVVIGHPGMPHLQQTRKGTFLILKKLSV